MKGWSPTWNQWLIAIGVGCLWGAAFPRIDWAALAWVVPGLLLVVGMAPAGGLGWRAVYVAGLAYGLTSLSWLLHMPFPAGAVAGWVALSLYVACYPALWFVICDAALRRLTAAGAVKEDQGGWCSPALDRILAGGWWRRALWTWMTAVLWVSLEMLLGRLFSGFPWNFLGVSQHGVLPLIQVASWTGVYGVSFLVVWVSIGLTLAVLRLVREAGSPGVWVAELWLPLLVTVLMVVAGFNRLTRVTDADRTLDVALVQPSIPQELIWDHEEDITRFERVMDLSRQALAANPDLLVWPEAAMPPFTRANFEALTNLVATHQVWMVFGADDVEPRITTRGEEEYDVFNSAFLFGPDGRYVSSYQKQKLVIFGEYIPFERWLPFMKAITPIEGSFTPGPGPVWFDLSDPRVRMSVLICFEDVFPHLARRHVTDDTELLLNLTNNGWFGQSAAHWQHAANAVFRAVENGVPLVRCTNNGITCWIDAHGRVRQILGSESGDVYGPGFLTASIPLRPAGAAPGPTLYRRYGDWFGWSCVVFSILILLDAGRLRRRGLASVR